MNIESRIEAGTVRNIKEAEGQRLDVSAGPSSKDFPGKAVRFPVSIVDKEGIILYCNEPMKAFAGRDVTGELCWEVWGKEHERCNGCPLLAASEPADQEVAEVSGTIDGRTLRITHSVMSYGGKDAFLQIIEDITETRRAQVGIAQAQKLESIGTLASGIAHDFNNLLGIIIGNASLIERAVENHEKVLKRADIINRAAERGTSLVKQLLTFARKSEPSYSSVSINRIVNDISKLFEETFPRSMRLLCNLSEDLPMVIGDPSQIHQVMLNLIVNAKDAMKGAGQIIISTEVVTTEVVHRLFPTATAAEYVLVGVSDNGEGMSKEVLEHIFEPFFTTKGKSNGTGLGLSVVSGIMEELHGFISVQSEPRRGTDFSLYFPTQQVASTFPTASRELDDDTLGGSETVMIVEDEDMLNEMLTSILSSKGYNVLRTNHGRQAVETYRDNKDEISLVISDFGLPNLTGGEVLTWLKEINPDVKFILSTGYLDPEERASIIEDGAKEIILKPFKPTDLLKKVRRVLDE